MNAPQTDMLRDFHTPEAIGFWPVAPGWWLLALIIIGVVLFTVIKLRKHHRRNRWRRQAAMELKALLHEFDQQPGPSLQSSLSALIKRSAATLGRDPRIKALPNHMWIEFVQRRPFTLSVDEATTLFESHYHATPQMLERQTLQKVTRGLRKLQPKDCLLFVPHPGTASANTQVSSDDQPVTARQEEL